MNGVEALGEQSLHLGTLVRWRSMAQNNLYGMSLIGFVPSIEGNASELEGFHPFSTCDSPTFGTADRPNMEDLNERFELFGMLMNSKQSFDDGMQWNW